ncbi:CAP-specific mRNA (Nucleoside-2'-O-)-methyltransferase 2 [Elysia marginata]|uniref:Cap-specific mRNA (nucleoside-2'-O-)-methyltransferase 2 n=1 Tax=Elysia marginata TaxID=1093978 RepID=A0AAV4F7C6_9GAST|nr:CAP-specific mRNA (Nucleoside-2'-O-)-methyltransferase 2 [Elysia marginata]
MTKKRKSLASKGNDNPTAMPKQARIPAPENISPRHVEEVRGLFDKKFRYTSKVNNQTGEHHASTFGLKSNKMGIKHETTVEDWFSVTPHVSTDSAVANDDPELMRLKREMNSVKDQLSNKDIETWHAHTTRCNLASHVIPYVKSLDVELCTQAWVKFYEILCTFQGQGLLPDQHFMSVHLCEAPGAFVTALNHFLQHKGFQHMWDWRATTLNPYHESNCLGEMIADDRLIRQTYIQWFFGEDGSGDITYPGHVKGLREMLLQAAENENLEVRLVTADGSKDCQTNPAEQESLVSRLHHCEALAAALILAPGGALVIKVFTMFETSSVRMMFLLNLMFDEVHVVKPATSKSGNSEMYLVCLGYRNNVAEETLWKLLDATVYSNNDGKMLSLIQPLPEDFIEEHRQCCRMFSQFQLDTIQTNLQLYTDMSEGQTQQLELKQRLVLDFFLQKTGLSNKGRRRQARWVAGYVRERSAFLFPHLSLSEPSLVIESPLYCLSSNGSTSHIRPSKHLQPRPSGTFQLRQSLCTMSWSERLKLIEYRDTSVPRLTEMQSRSPLEDCELDELTELDTGQAFSAVLTSRLCDYERCRQWHFVEHARWLGQTVAQLLAPAINTSTHLLPENSAVPPSKLLTAAPHDHRKSCQIYFWDRGRGEEVEKSSPLYLSFIEALPDPGKVTVVNSGTDAAVTSDGPALFFCNLTSFCDARFKSAWSSRFEELLCRAKCVQCVADILKSLSIGSDVVLLIPTLLTRLTSSLVYILARCFGSIRLESPPNLWLHQLLKLADFRGAGPGLVSHLLETGERLQQEVESGQTYACLMEVVSFPLIVCDRKFVQLITAHNNRSIAGFLNVMLDHTRELNHTGGSTQSHSDQA